MATGQLTNWVLWAAVTYVAPFSRAMVPSSNAVIASSGRRTPHHIILDFSSEEGRMAVHQWYERQGPHTRFTSLEYRTDRGGQLRHEFIVVRLDDGTICRFDRRAREDRRGHALKDEGTAAEDSVHVLRSFEAEYQELDKESEVLLSISFPTGEDLKLILAICLGIQCHPRAASYNLLRFNCYFFSWTIVTAVARRAVKWEDIMTSGVVQKAVRNTVNNHIRTHTVPSHSTLTRIRNWFANPTQRYASILSDKQDTKDFWGPFAYHLISKGHLWDLRPVLQKVLLRSQLNASLTKESRRFIEATWLGVMCLLAEGNIRRLVSSKLKRELREFISRLFKPKT